MMTKKISVLDDNIKIGRILKEIDIRNKCEDKDYMFLSKNTTCEKIQILLNIELMSAQLIVKHWLVGPVLLPLLMFVGDWVFWKTIINICLSSYFM